MKRPSLSVQLPPQFRPYTHPKKFLKALLIAPNPICTPEISVVIPNVIFAPNVMFVPMGNLTGFEMVLFLTGAPWTVARMAKRTSRMLTCLNHMCMMVW